MRGVFFALLAVVVSEYFYFPRTEVLGAQVRIVDILILTLLPAAILRGPGFCNFWDMLRMHRLMFLCLGLLLAATVISIPLAYKKWVAFKEAVQLAEHIFLFLSAFLVFSAEGGTGRLRTLIAVVVAVSILQASIAYFQFLLGIGDTTFVNGMIRVSGTLGNFLSGYMMIGLLAATAVALAERRGLYFAAAVMIFGVVVLAQVRSVWILGFPALGALLLALKGYSSMKGVRNAFFPLFMGALAIVVFAFPRGSVWLDTFSSRGTATLGARVELWKSAVRMFLVNPVTGVGAGNFYLLFNDDRFATEGTKKIPPNFGLTGKFTAHSEIFTPLAETGVVGAVVYLAFFCFLAGRARALVLSGSRDVYSSRLLPAIALLFFCFIPFADFPGGKLFWVLSGIISGLASDSAGFRQFEV
jgi:O-antigen ligase